MIKFGIMIFMCIVGFVGCGPSMAFDGGAHPAEENPSDHIQKWWNCFIDSNTDYDNTDIENTEILWLSDGDTAEEAAQRVLPSITKVIKSGLNSGKIKMENPGEELSIEVLYCEPN